MIRFLSASTGVGLVDKTGLLILDFKVMVVMGIPFLE
jgi:hypothetical protein